MGALEKTIRFYRRRGLGPTAARAAGQAMWQARRARSLLRWRLTGEASLPVGDGSVRLHATAPVERRTIWYLNEFEAEDVDRLLATVDADDVFYDVGANIGYHTCLVAGLTGATVHAFEPHPRNARRLSENLALNGADATVHELALGATDAEIEFAVDATDEPGFGHGTVTVDRPAGGADREITVEQRTADGLVAAGVAPAPTVVKIDVEGAEGRVLEGMTEQLESGSVRTLFLEIHRPAAHRQSVADFGTSEAELVTDIESLGFAIVSSETTDAERRLIATR